MVHVQKGACFGLSLALCTIFKICRHFFGNGDFQKFVKNLNPQKFQLVECFQSDAPCCSHTCKELVENLLKKDFSQKKKCVTTFLPPKLSVRK